MRATKPYTLRSEHLGVMVLSGDVGKRGLIMKRLGVALAVNELCEKSDLKSISTDEICAKATISRSTFYRLFDDKYDIAVWCHRLPLEEGVGQMGRTLTCSEATCTSLEGLLIFRNLFKAAREIPGIMSVREQGKDEASELMLSTLRDCHGVEIDDEVRFAVDWVADASTSASFRWLFEEDPIPAAEVAERFEACYPASLLRYFGHPVDPRPRKPFDLSNYFKKAAES